MQRVRNVSSASRSQVTGTLHRAMHYTAAARNGGRRRLVFTKPITAKSAPVQGRFTFWLVTWVRCNMRGFSRLNLKLHPSWHNETLQ